MSAAPKALVIGDDTRSFLATVRSLGRAGIEVHASPFSFGSPALKSRYLSRLHWLPYYLGDGREWLKAFEALLDREKFTIVIPCDERALIPLDRYREQLAQRTHLAIPNAQGMAAFFDKNKTRELAQSLDVPVARGRVVETNDTARQAIEEFGLPLAVKPSSSYSPDGLYARNRVIIADDLASLEAALAEARGHPYFFELFFSGTGVGVSVLANEGRVLQAFQHRRVHELKGASYYRISEELSQPLVEAVGKMIAATRYTGVAMFEFRVNDKTGAWILLEVNARPWGSLPLPVALGVDFPYRWYQLLVEGIETPEFRYKPGMYGRNLVPDMRYVIEQAKSCRKPFPLAAFLLRSLGEYLRLFVGREVHDVLVTDDARPALYEMWNQIAGATNDRLSELRRYATRSRERDRRALDEALRRTKGPTCKIAIVCQGNICRSPLAAALLERELTAQYDHFEIRSFGNLPRMGAASPANAITAAKSWSINLQPHRSQHFSRDAADTADAIVIFDGVNRRWIRERYPDINAPIVMLGSFASSIHAARIIADPDGSDVMRFERTYGAIMDAVGGLAQRIREACNA